MQNLRNKLHQRLLNQKEKNNYNKSIRQIFLSYKNRIIDTDYTYELYYATDKEIKNHYIDEKEYFNLGEDYEDFLYLKCERDFYKIFIKYFETEIEYLFSNIYDFENEYNFENESRFVLLKTYIQLKIVKMFIKIIAKIINKKTNKQIIHF